MSAFKIRLGRELTFSGILIKHQILKAVELIKYPSINGTPKKKVNSFLYLNRLLNSFEETDVLTGLEVTNIVCHLSFIGILL